MEKDLSIRKIALFLCRKWKCWIKPESCIKRQKGYILSNKNTYKLPDFDLNACINCEQGKAIKELSKSYFKFVKIKKEIKHEKKEKRPN